MTDLDYQLVDQINDDFCRKQMRAYEARIQKINELQHQRELDMLMYGTAAGVAMSILAVWIGQLIWH